jgi:epoxyqueuosine reductase
MGLTERICDKARDLGFDLVGVAPAPADAYLAPHLDRYRSWIARGYHGEMGYMARADRVERRMDPGRIVPGVSSVICVGLNYYPGVLADDRDRDPAYGLISNYAWGLDYHDVMLPRLEQLAAFARAEAGREVSYRVYVDTGPVLERAYAARAGLGFIGKNTCLIHPKMGSWLFLGEVLIDVELAPTSEQGRVGCGTCRRCLDACPTGALVEPYVLDARRCISYLTIELKGPIPHRLRPLVGNWIYGCDVCQVVCPWQRFARSTRQPAFLAEAMDHTAPALQSLIGMGEDAFHRRYEGGPILRIGRGRLLRNVAVALGNWGDERAATSLVGALADEEPLVRGHAAWALARIGGRVARTGLAHALRKEQDSYVRYEIEVAISMV